MDTNLVSFWNFDLTETLIDSFSESNSDSSGVGFTATVTGIGQIFNNASSATLSSCQFYLKKTGTPTGNANAKVYAITGTPNSNAIPTGSALATSDNFDVSTLTGSLTLVPFTFSGANQISLSASTDYAIVVEYSGADASNRPDFGVDLTSPADTTGNACRRTSGTWTSQSYDVCFYVYSIAAISLSDSFGPNTLTAVNSPVLTAGKVGNAYDFESSSSQSLTITDGAQSGLDLGSSWTLSFWINFESDAADSFIIGKYTVSGNQRSYLIYRNQGNNTLNLATSADGSGTITDNGHTFSPTPGTWYHVVVTYSSGTENMYVNNSSIGSSSGYSNPFNSTANFSIGESNGGNYFDGKIDSVGVWSRVLNSSERSILYNSGNGAQYPFIQNIVMTADQGSYTLAGQDVALSLGKSLVAEVGYFVLTGFDAVLNFRGWVNKTKNQSTFSNQSKNSSTWTNNLKS